ncbi:hypothetical protein QWY20_16340 [Alkalimonas sp. MEB108]|uniref:Toprim domain-containing protein n=1 Tax=Alkalimonas cellulosilytica TaxID=3058395 RepID=A0ABU7J923_9GAMM|nr:hypothetical protein [Alkalimonas sp. MEB108]MEE2003029.1 hypothetical protein [Alkalimonas sp. MEB108]
MAQSLSNYPSVSALLHQAQQAIVDVAAPLGIDAIALLAQLPEHSIRLTGRQVPVLHKRSRGTCSVLYYINQTPSGQAWPFLRFHTFKDGGITADFNGLRWLRSQPGVCLTKPTAIVANKAVHHRLSNLAEREDKSRALYFKRLQQAYEHAGPVDAKHPYLQKRLAGLATASLVDRCAMRQVDTRLMVAIEQLDGRVIGFQLIYPQKSTDNKRNHVAFSGAMRGSFVRVAAVRGLKYFPILFCEGVFTALSLALVWPGEIRAVLGCHNYQPCRKHLRERVYFAHDHDTHKPAVGNVGLSKAMQAALPGDYFITPQFFPMHQPLKPTDFNDMLLLYGIRALQQVFEQPWCYEDSAQKLHHKV